MDLNQPNKHMLSTDRVLVLSVIDGQRPLSSTGLADPRLFTGENKLHAIKDPQTCMWFLKYEQGGIPPVLKQMFTSFKMLLKFTRDYFEKRNIEIKEILD
jgi:hypothetical protein